jgi:hypothetical protein
VVSLVVKKIKGENDFLNIIINVQNLSAFQQLMSIYGWLSTTNGP